MKKALEHNKASWSYVKGILQSWSEKGIATIEEAQAEASAFKKQKKQKHPRPHQAKKQEIIPDWFTQNKKASPTRSVLAKQQVDVADLLNDYCMQKELG
ncbi:DNA replication protein DnaD [Aquibacillus albus]|uniref:DNA replication protein DnaD n=2 Tax=Aquibacillus albus TaxID=1168171 RepID=A0ABS2N3G6_9BACI|nr:DNA replication protein DnaD [Aquibacillus albus]